MSGKATMSFAALCLAALLASGAPAHAVRPARGARTNTAASAANHANRDQQWLNRFGQGLNLTADQNTQLLAIHDAEVTNVKSIEKDARSQMLAVLTPDQVQALKNRAKGRRGAGAARATGHGKGDQAWLSRFGQGLNLSDDQKTKLTAIHDTTVANVKAAEKDARPQMLALLTPDQRKALKARAKGHRQGTPVNPGTPAVPVTP